MKFLQITLLFCIASFVASVPPLSLSTDLSLRDASPLHSFNYLEKRKGGGGGKGSGGSGGSSGSSSGGRTGSGSSSGGSSTRPNGVPYSFSPSSNVGGRTRDGSGTPKAYGGRYTGGAVVPFTAGKRSPTLGVAPFFIGAGALAFFPGLWLYGSVWAYPYGFPYHWTDPDGRNRTSNVTCLCQQYQVCGCDPNDNSTFLTQVVTNGSSTPVAPVNTSTVRTVTFSNGSTSTYINGSLANGTTADGGTDPSDPSQVSASVRMVVELSGYWAMLVIVGWGMWMVA
ncbi:uncharacterized protein Z519_08940 [Cladophialophora bantiana CBS 173.52]|uniref:DUF7732 domain-containing protein n=1 Tax=Cladophialophora bantiana (strain ATCC 10958 / CBS 173.52 / CDC B-1940 / NIH 8579) TaxID=1442370 RepID=A0A0D2EJV4_CLAB1|nr:uncharacterized protein Z519_08940 [Cladophialophora bantiana CBS 173.52]KIW90296.1 hypothetical protein Z519_08940 [Cladophialophora bantiana CBS 173.52]